MRKLTAALMLCMALCTTSAAADDWTIGFQAGIGVANFDNIDDHEQMKLSIPWPDGDGGESPWGRQLGDELALLCNEPLYPGYRFHDMVQFSAHNHQVRKVIHRPYPVKLVFSYENPPERDDGMPWDEDRCRRDIQGVINSRGAVPGFVTSGNGYALLRDPKHATLIKADLLALDAGVSEVKVQGFDFNTDQYVYTEVG